MLDGPWGRSWARRAGASTGPWWGPSPCETGPGRVQMTHRRVSAAMSAVRCMRRRAKYLSKSGHAGRRLRAGTRTHAHRVKRTTNRRHVEEVRKRAFTSLPGTSGWPWKTRRRWCLLSCAAHPHRRRCCSATGPAAAWGTALPGAWVAVGWPGSCTLGSPRFPCWSCALDPSSEDTLITGVLETLRKSPFRGRFARLFRRSWQLLCKVSLAVEVADRKVTGGGLLPHRTDFLRGRF